MNIAPSNEYSRVATPTHQSPEALRRAAEQFEAVFLTQLTSAMNSTSGPDEAEDNLFGGDGGTGLAKQMFAEQLAQSMAKAGGVGLADLIATKLGAPRKTVSNRVAAKGISTAANAVKQIKQDLSPATAAKEKPTLPAINRSAKAFPLERNAAPLGGGEVEVISRFEDQIRAEGIDDSLKNLVLGDHIVNTTRPRIAANAAITEIDPVSATGAKTKVDYQYPVIGRRSSGFGSRFHPIDHRTKFHAGVDIAVPLGTSVKASADGVVTFAGWQGDYGNLVVVKHADGRETRYGHLSKVLVAEGDKITGGERIALSGSTGKSTGPHVHFEMRENGQALNPVKILSNVLRANAER